MLTVSSLTIRSRTDLVYLSVETVANEFRARIDRQHARFRRLLGDGIDRVEWYGAVPADKQGARTRDQIIERITLIELE